MLRRRRGKDDPPHGESSSNNSTNNDGQEKDDGVEEITVITRQPIKRNESFMTKPKSKRRNGLIFALGGLFGIFLALFFANHQEVINLDAIMDLNLETLMDVIPQGIVRDAKEFTVYAMAFLMMALSLYDQANLKADCEPNDSSNMNEKPSATIPSPSDCTSRRKASRRNTR